MDMLPIGPISDPDVENDVDGAVPNNQDLPKEMAIFGRVPSDFLPKGKTYNELTPEEQAMLKSQYRFSPYRPGIYQGITGRGNCI